MTQSNKPLRGIIPPMATPMSTPDTLDVEGLNRLIEHLIGGGVNGIFVLGTTGEAPSHSYELRQQLLEKACEFVNGRVPILVGITDTSAGEAVNFAKLAKNAGAYGLVCAPPFYFRPTQSELLDFMLHLADNVPLPLYVYNMPSLTNVAFAVDTTLKALEHPNVHGVKDSGGNMVYFHALRQALKGRTDKSLFIGPEEMLAEALLLGADGGVPGGGNACPGLYAELYKTATAGDLKKTVELQANIMALSKAIYSCGEYGSSFLKGVKCVLEELGVCKALPAAPLKPVSDAERRRISEAFAKLNFPPAWTGAAVAAK